MHVLFVEDHAGTRRAVSRSLKAQGHDVRAVATVDEALSDTIPTSQLDVALIDYRLGGGTGIEVVAHLGAVLPCVLYTQSDDPEVLQRALAAGAVGYLLKSDPPALVMLALEQAVHGQHPISAQMTRHLLPSRPGGPTRYEVTVDLFGLVATVVDPSGPSATFRTDHQVALLYALGRRFDNAALPTERGWMADEELMMAVWGRPARQPKPNNLNVLVHRVRRDAQGAGLDRGFIEKREGRSRLVVASVRLT